MLGNTVGGTLGNTLGGDALVPSNSKGGARCASLLKEVLHPPTHHSLLPSHPLNPAPLIKPLLFSRLVMVNAFQTM